MRICNVFFVALSVFFTHNIVTAGQIIELPVVGNNVNIRERPLVSSAVMFKLNIGDHVQIVKPEEVAGVVDGNKGHWVYVKSLSCSGDEDVDECKGWIFDYYLGYPEKFVRVSNWEYKEYSGCVGDFCPSYKFNRNGSFELTFSVFSNEKREVYKGYLYRYLDFIVAKADGYKGIPLYLFITRNGTLCMPGIYCGKK